MADPPKNRPPTKGPDRAPATAGSGTALDAFLSKATALAPKAAMGRLVFALDATMSRQPTWDLAREVQAEMFKATADVGGLRVQLVYFRGGGECRASSFVDDARALTGLMGRIDCRGGFTQIEKVLIHVREEARGAPIRAFVYVGDAMEEEIDRLCGVAGELGLLGVKAFMFQEGHDPTAEKAFREIARLTGGAHARFDPGAAGTLRDLLRAVAVYAAGGRAALERLAHAGGESRRLLGQIR